MIPVNPFEGEAPGAKRRNTPGDTRRIQMRNGSLVRSLVVLSFLSGVVLAATPALAAGLGGVTRSTQFTCDSGTGECTCSGGSDSADCAAMMEEVCSDTITICDVDGAPSCSCNYREGPDVLNTPTAQSHDDASADQREPRKPREARDARSNGEREARPMRRETRDERQVRRKRSAERRRVRHEARGD